MTSYVNSVAKVVVPCIISNFASISMLKTSSMWEIESKNCTNENHKKKENRVFEPQLRRSIKKNSDSKKWIYTKLCIDEYYNTVNAVWLLKKLTFFVVQCNCTKPWPNDFFRGFLSIGKTEI